MKSIELYTDDLLDVVSLGKTYNKIFDENNGDYIKMELRDIKTDTVLHTFYSNKLMLQYETSDYYFGDYHYMESIYMEGKDHIDDLHSILIPTKNYDKQFNIYRDEKNNIYIKPNEVLEKIHLEENKYKLILYFLRDIKSLLSKYLQKPKVFDPEKRYATTPSEEIVIPNLIPLYRFWNSKENKHYYTTDQNEYENITSNPNYKDWKFERIEGYIPDINYNEGNNT